MNTDQNNRSATIHEFPTARVRAAAAARRHEAQRLASREPAMMHEDFSGSWYHEAAMREADPDRRH